MICSRSTLFRFVVDHGHLTIPLGPGVAVCDQISHEVSHVDAAGFAGRENRISYWGPMHVVGRDFIFIDQVVRSYGSPFNGFIALTDFNP